MTNLNDYQMSPTPFISLFGGVTGYILHPPGEQKNIEQNQIKQEKTIAMNEIKTVVSEQ